MFTRNTHSEEFKFSCHLRDHQRSFKNFMTNQPVALAYLGDTNSL